MSRWIPGIRRASRRLPWRATGRFVTAVAAVVACAVCLLALPAGLAAPAIGADSTAIFYFSEDDVDADPGETVTVELVVSDHGDYDENGIDELAATVEYDVDVLTATDVEPGPMLAAGDDDADVNGSADVDEEGGTVSIEQERDPPGDGARATDVAATITFDVAEDAPATSTPLEITDASARLVTDYPRATVERDGTVHVAGGAADEGDGNENGGDAVTGGAEDDPDGVTLANGTTDGERPGATTGDASETDGSDASVTDESDDASGADSVPGLGAPAATAALLAALGSRIVARRS